MHVDAAQIIFVTSTTRALDVALESLRPSRVISCDLEHDSENRLFQLITHKFGTSVTRVPVPRSRTQAVWQKNFTDAVLAECATGNRNGRTIVMLSHVCYSNGLRLPVEDICHDLQAMQPRVVAIVDGAHAVGQEHVDLDAFPFAFYAFSGHKWLFGPPTLGVLVVGKDTMKEAEVYERLEVETYESLAFRGRAPDEKTSSISLDPFVGLSASLNAVFAPDLPDIRDNLRALRSLFIELANKSQHVDVVNAHDSPTAAGMLNVQRRPEQLSYSKLLDVRRLLESKKQIVVKAVQEPLPCVYVCRFICNSRKCSM